MLHFPSPSAFGGSTAIRSIADQLSAREISRSPQTRCGGPAPLEACQRSLIASPPFLPVLSVSPPSFLQLQPDKAADQICPRCLAIFLNGSLSVFALRRIAKLVRFSALAMVSTLFALRTSARSSLSRSGVQGRRGVPVICSSPPSRRDRSVIVRRQANAVPRLRRAMRLPFAYTDHRRAYPA
jgi:hypothetical protein